MVTAWLGGQLSPVVVGVSLRLRVSLTPQAVQRKRPGMGCWAPQPYGTRHSTAPSFSRALEGIFGHCGDTRCLLSGQPWERKLGLREWKCGFCSRFAEAAALSCVTQSPRLAGLPPLREGLSMQAPCVCPGHRRVAPSGPEPTAGPATQIVLVFHLRSWYLLCPPHQLPRPASHWPV